MKRISLVLLGMVLLAGVAGCFESSAGPTPTGPSVNVTGTWVSKQYALKIRIVQHGSGLTTSGGKLTGSWSRNGRGGEFDDLTFIGQEYKKGIYGYDRNDIAFGGKLVDNKTLHGWWMNDEQENFATTFTKQ